MFIYLLIFLFSGHSHSMVYSEVGQKEEILCWEANIKCFKVPLFRKYFSLSSSLLDKIVSRFIFNEFIITSVQSTCKRPYNSNSRVHRRLKKVNGRKQNSKNVHAKKKETTVLEQFLF